MKFPDKADEELVNTLNLMNHFPDRADRLEHEMNEHYLKNINDAEASFAFGLFSMIRKSKEGMLLSTRHVDDIIRVYDNALRIIPDYWLVHILKAIIFLSLMETFRNDDELSKTLELLLKLQNESERKEPYFIVPYICKADYIYYTQNNREMALNVLALGEKSVPKSPIGFNSLKKYLYMPLGIFIKRLKIVHDSEAINRLKRIWQIYFNNDQDLEKINLTLKKFYGMEK
jgi:hypothetical protein